MESMPSNIESFVQSGLLKSLVVAVLILVVTAVVSHVVTRFIHRVSDIDGAPVPSGTITINIARVLVWGLGICAVLSAFGIDVSALLAALGVGGIALSLGLKDTIANFLGGLQITFMKIVQVGEYITVGGASGIVQDITWRQTVIKDIDGIEHTIPNSVINSTTVSKAGAPLLVAAAFSTDAHYDDLDALAERICKAAKPAIEAIGPLERDPWVLFSDIGDYGIHGKLRFVMKDATHLREARDAALRAIAPFME